MLGTCVDCTGMQKRRRKNPVSLTALSWNSFAILRTVKQRILKPVQTKPLLSNQSKWRFHNGMKFIFDSSSRVRVFVKFWHASVSCLLARIAVNGQTEVTCSISLFSCIAFVYQNCIRQIHRAVCSSVPQSQSTINFIDITCSYSWNDKHFVSLIYAALPKCL